MLVSKGEPGHACTLNISFSSQLRLLDPDIELSVSAVLLVWQHSMGSRAIPQNTETSPWCSRYVEQSLWL